MAIESLLTEARKTALEMEFTREPGTSLLLSIMLLYFTHTSKMLIAIAKHLEGGETHDDS